MQRSFSQEWLDYSYDGVLWSWSYEERERLFLEEMGPEIPASRPCRFLEVGCGIGLVTSFAAKNYPGEAVGLDLSLAALRAARKFREHPFLHFVQASLWRPPFDRESFDLLYSHGVLHHTYDTKAAFDSIAPLCRQGGRTYIWVYGDAGTTETLSRRLAYLVERATRPAIARMNPGRARLVTAPLAIAYIAANWAQRSILGRASESYNFERAHHAVRDRFTPLFAHRHCHDEVKRWFTEAGFGDIYVLTESAVTDASRESIRRNVAMRGTRVQRSK